MRDYNFNDRTYGEKEADRHASRQRAERDEAAYQRLEVGQTVRTPQGWTGGVAEKLPDGRRVYVETWDKGADYRASRVEPVDEPGGTGGVSL